MAAKNPKKSKNFKSHPPPYKYPPWFKFISHPFHHIFTLFFTHTMSLSNLSEIEDQLTIAFQCVIEEDMSILQVEEVAAAATSSSTQGPKRRR
jgi:hypothetical protein